MVTAAGFYGAPYADKVLRDVDSRRVISAYGNLPRLSTYFAFFWGMRKSAPNAGACSDTVDITAKVVVMVEMVFSNEQSRTTRNTLMQKEASDTGLAPCVVRRAHAYQSEKTTRAAAATAR